jgi:hypothetical protein
MPNGHLSLEPGGPRVCQVFSSYKRTSENAGRVNFLESRLGEVGPSPCLLARGRAHKSPTRWPRALACTKTATTSHRKGRTVGEDGENDGPPNTYYSEQPVSGASSRWTIFVCQAVTSAYELRRITLPRTWVNKVLIGPTSLSTSRCQAPSAPCARLRRT